MMKKLVFTTVFVLISLSIVYVLFFSSFFSINTYDIDGVKFSSKQVKIVLDKYRNKNIFLTNKNDIKKDLMSINFTKNAIVSKKYPSKILVTIEEMVPVGQLKHKNKYLLISDEFKVLDISPKHKKIPIFKGFEYSKPEIGKEISVQPTSIFERAKDLGKLLQLTDIPNGYIEYKNNSIYYYINENYCADFGKDGDISKKFTLFMSVYESLKKQGVNKGVIRIYDNKRLTFQPFEEELNKK